VLRIGKAECCAEAMASPFCKHSKGWVSICTSKDKSIREDGAVQPVGVVISGLRIQPNFVSSFVPRQSRHLIQRSSRDDRLESIIQEESIPQMHDLLHDKSEAGWASNLFSLLVLWQLSVTRWGSEPM
jgi:hypothetical protein